MHTFSQLNLKMNKFIGLLFEGSHSKPVKHKSDRPCKHFMYMYLAGYIMEFLIPYSTPQSVASIPLGRGVFLGGWLISKNKWNV